MSAVELYRACLIGGGFFVAGMAALVLVEYGRAALHDRRALVRHVAMIAASYLLLLSTIIAGNFKAIELDIQFTWPSLIPPFAYVTGAIALTVILRDVRRRREQGVARRSTDA